MRGRLLVLAFIVIALVALPLSLIFLSHYRDSLESHYRFEVRAVAAGLASAVFDPATARQAPQMQDITREVADRTAVDIAYLVDRSGRIWAHTDPGKVGEEYQAASAQGDYFDESVPIGSVGGELLGYAHAGIRRSRMERELTASLGGVGLVFAVAIILASALAVIASSYAARPIGNLTQAALAIAEGDLDQRVDSDSGPEEIRRTARAFEQMRTGLKSHMERLQHSYRELDRKVRDLSILYSVSEAMNTGDYSEALLDTLLSAAVNGSGARFGALYIVGEGSGAEVRLASSRGYDPRSTTGAGEERSNALKELSELTIVRGNDALKSGQEPLPQTRDLSDKGLFLVGVPLIVRTRAAGAIVVGREDSPPESEDVLLLQTLASHAARCVERSQLYTASITDGLTGLFVSRYFRMRLADELRSAARYRYEVSLLMLDIDHFKKVNDTYGHPAGDKVLKNVARCVLSTIRDGVDIAARYGGEEFAVILPRTASDGAVILAERLREMVAGQTVTADGKTIGVTVSIGVATFPEAGLRPEVLIEKADAALYQAKAAGRDRVVGNMIPPHGG